MKVLFFKFFSIFLGLFLFILLIEASLRLTAWTIIESQKFSYSEPNFNDKNEIRIVVLGESTSAEYFAQSADVSWPKLLEQKLNAKYPGIKFKVYNLAVPSINTTQLLELYFSNYSQIRPHITIAMMGINDTSAIETISGLNLRSLKSYKLLKWIISGLGKSGLVKDCQRAEFPQSLNLDLDQKIKNGDFNFDHLKPEQVSNFNYYRVLGQKLFGVSDKRGLPCDNHCINQKQRMYELANSYLQRAISVCPIDHDTLRSSFFVSSNLQQQPVARKNFEIAVQHGYSPDPGTLSYILTFADMSDKNDFIFNYAREHNLTISNKSPLTATKNNYFRLIKFARNNASKLILMSYPTALLNALKNVLVENGSENSEIFAHTIYKDSPNPGSEFLNDIYFVSNENFNDKLREIHFNELFTDNFCSTLGCRFGHTTTLGHELIADNIVNQSQTLFADLLK
jgi:hypothetical protein